MVFYSTPHGGSQIAKLNSVVKYIFFPTVEVQELGKETMNLYYYRIFSVGYVMVCEGFVRSDSKKFGFEFEFSSRMQH